MKTETRTQKMARMIDDVNDLILACEELMDQHCPFECTAERCECGPNGTGFGDDGKPCIHIKAMRAIAKARGE